MSDGEAEKVSGSAASARGYDPARPLFSLHVPKTAGTSFRNDLEGWFGREQMAFHYRGDQGEPPARAPLRPGLCVHGHFNRLRGIGVRQYYPEADQLIVLLRDPFDRFVSTWRYLHFQIRSGVSAPDFADAPDLETWLDRRRAVDPTEDPFSFLAQLADPTDPADPAAVFGPQYLAVGVTERYVQSVELIAAVLGRPPPAEVTRLNRAGEPHRLGDPAEARPDLRQVYERAFPLEYAVYAAALARLEAGRRTFGL
ncbi:sulfotransferase family 2 domain-containing protein [Phenylobacterium sp. LjRoot225]|uniref:sulfotransferase family 2 domain-containing protein n=1 Tax=Phenylobacterium sp. LjRoot225 TaxID=3342285 RepID=UPI003ECC89CF